jgi:hypothetical protein
MRVLRDDRRRGLPAVDEVASEILTALDAAGAGPLPGYTAGLRAACGASPPAFGTGWYRRRYRELARVPGWLAVSLVVNAEKEGEGSRKLWRLAARADDPDVAEQVRRHALDESRHALVYLALLDTVFPGSVRERDRARLRELSPRYRAGDKPRARRRATRRRVLDELIQMNIGEIRTRLNQLLLAPAARRYCPARGRRRLARMLTALLADETRHIAYTARLLERAIVEGEGAFVRRTMARRLAEFNAITLAEVAGGGHAQR